MLINEKPAESTDLNFVNMIEHITSEFFIGVTLHVKHLLVNLFTEDLARVNDLLDNLSVTHLLLSGDRFGLRLPLLPGSAIDESLDGA